MGERALVIDDNDNNLTLERDLLEVAGFEVFTAENAAAGIALAKKELPDIIIMDMRLPDMRGSDAAKLLLLDGATRGIPIVFVTASVLAEGIEEIKTIPNAVFVSKPINTRTFAKEIRLFMKKA
jgi:two-component system, cell cycle response regulator DivK